MDQGTIGSIFTVIVSSYNKKNFDEAANLVFDDEKKTNLNKEDQES
jgi:cytochrome c oxidase cbb3-type subunit 4